MERTLFLCYFLTATKELFQQRAEWNLCCDAFSLFGRQVFRHNQRVRFVPGATEKLSTSFLSNESTGCTFVLHCEMNLCPCPDRLASCWIVCHDNKQSVLLNITSFSSVCWGKFWAIISDNSGWSLSSTRSLTALLTGPNINASSFKFTAVKQFKINYVWWVKQIEMGALKEYKKKGMTNEGTGNVRGSSIHCRSTKKKKKWSNSCCQRGRC